MYLDEMTRVSMLAFCKAVMKREPDVIIGDVKNPYVHRWHLAERGDNANAYIHRFFRDDDDRALHDHRYDNTSFVLENGYDEWFHKTPLSIKDGHYETEYTRRVEGSIVSRLAHTPHRVTLIDGKPCTTLFFTGPAYRKWGFHTVDGWVDWKKFTAVDSMSGGTYEHTV